MTPFARVFICLALTLLAGTAKAIVVVDFEQLDDGLSLQDQIPGMVFSNAIVLGAGLSLNELEFPPRSGTIVASDDGGAMTIVFTTPARSVTAYFTYGVPLELVAFDAQDNPLTVVHSAFDSNLALSGEAGSAPNEGIGVIAEAGMAYLRISGDAGGASFVMDDLTVASVPEPNRIVLLLAGALAVAALARRRAGARTR